MLTVYINRRIHVDTFKAEDDTVIISCFIRGIGKVLPIPADAVFIEILRIIDQPVMGQIHPLHFGFPDLPVFPVHT